MKKTNLSSTVGLLVLLTIALIAGLVLMQRNQNTQRGAYFAGTTVFLQPTAATVTVGQPSPIQLWVQSGQIAGGTDLAKVDFVQTRICYSGNVSFDPAQVANLVTVNSDAFDTVQLASVNNNCLDIAISSNKPAASLKSGLMQVATIRFTGVNAGSGTFSLVAANTKVSGNNPNASSTDMSLAIQSVTGASYTVGQGTNNGNWDVANFKFSFIGQVVDGQCAANWPISIVALNQSNGLSNTYSNIIPTRDSVVDGKVVYRVSQILTGFNQTSNVALFIKGPKHLQIKYGQDNQTAMYNAAGGQLTMTSDSSTSPMHDFTGYPLLAGDLNQDGVVNGLDYALLKPEALSHKTVSPGGNLDGDLDGDCVVTSNDVQLFKTSLLDKQGQLY